MDRELSKKVVDQADDLRRRFADAQPFRYVTIDSFLDPDFCAQLIAEFPRFDQKNAISETGESGEKAVFSNLADLSVAYARFDRLMRDPEFLSLVSRVTGIPNLLYDPDYVGGGTHDNRNGQELDTHVDFNYHPRTQAHRRLNLIVFLNPEWQENWGGCLELVRGPWVTDEKDRNVVVPIANRCVIFETTESSWHGFRRIQLPPGSDLSRKSIAVYFYTKDRPARESVASHQTFYFHRPLPEHIRAGYTLLDGDVQEIRTLIARRDQTIQFLYRREMEISETLENASKVAGSKSYQLARLMTSPVRAVRRLLARIGQLLLAHCV